MTYPDLLAMTWQQYSGTLEETTGWSVSHKRIDGEDAFFLVDPYGDHDGDPWYDLTDLVSETSDRVLEALEEAEAVNC